MRAVVPVLAALVLVAGVTPGCVREASGEDSGSPLGEWWGGFGLMDGDRVHWTHFTADLKADGSRITGQGVYIAGPDPSSLQDKTVEISGRIEQGRLRLRLAYGGKHVECDAHHDTQQAEGTCRAGGETMTLRLVRVEPLGTADVAAMRGVYEVEPGHRILIGNVGPVPTMVDLRSGTFRMLFHTGADEWSAGPRVLVGTPVEWRLKFDDATLSIRREGGPPVEAKLRPRPTEEEFSFDSEQDGITLRGTLTLPAGPGPHPAIVFVHGSGKTPRSEAMFFPQYLSDLGFAVLAYDKRGAGESGGSYAMPDGSTFNVAFLRRRGADVVSGMNALRRHPAIDGKRVGLFGISQAGWVMPVAASSTDCSFTISLAGGATRLEVEQLYSELTDELRSDASLPSVEDSLAKVRARPVLGYDWGADFATQRCPGLWIYGLRDRINPSQLSVEVLERVKAEHKKDFTIVQFPRGNHPLMEARLGGKDEFLVLTGFVPELFTTIETWLVDNDLMP